ncbi:MAG: hypothetical protein JRH20_32580, partial [Deltaproteobacteria bacterium]|nr:hypothetical protein [Deltaproteobacteria bacterium]
MRGWSCKGTKPRRASSNPRIIARQLVVLLHLDAGGPRVNWGEGGSGSSAASFLHMELSLPLDMVAAAGQEDRQPLLR